VSRDLDLWAYQRGVTLDFSRPGKPTDNAFIEAFNGRFRAECLNTHWFLSLADTQEKVETWRRYYNEERPMGQSATDRRFCCKTAMAPPARQRVQSPKTLVLGGPKFGLATQTPRL
jgi:transposase InsO family protein